MNVGYLFNRIKVRYSDAVFGDRWYVMENLIQHMYRKNGGKPLKVMEVGVEKGETLRYLMLKQGAGRGSRIGRYTAIDPWYMEGKESLDDVLDFYAKNVTNFCETHNSAINVCDVHRKKSLDFSFEQSGSKELYDLIFVDAEHELNAVHAEIDHFMPMLKKGGVFAGHDFSLNHMQVVLAVFSKLVEDGQQKTIYMGTDTTWWLYKDWD